MSTNQSWSLDKPFTESYSSDIALLSAWLHGQQPAESSTQPCPRNYSSLTFLNRLSTLLTTGNERSPSADNVHAVSGYMDTNLIHCLIFSENAGPKYNLQRAISRHVDLASKRQAYADDICTRVNEQYPDGPGHGKTFDPQAARAFTEASRAANQASMSVFQASQAITLTLQETQNIPIGPKGASRDDYDIKTIQPDKESGHTLLKTWSADDDLPSDAHLQHVFDILCYLSSISGSEEKGMLLPPLQHFIHRRAFRKLGSQVLLFSTHWDRVPFDILAENIPLISSDPHLSRTFELTLPPAAHETVELSVHAAAKVAGSKLGYIYNLNPANLARWAALFQYLWDEIELCLLEKNSKDKWRVRSKMPEHEVFPVMVLHIQVLHCLKTVIKHLFSLPSLEVIIWKAEAGTMVARTRAKQDHLLKLFHRDCTFSNYHFPSSPNVVKDSEQGPDPKDLHLFNELGGQEELPQLDLEGQEELYEEMTDSDTPVERVMHSLGTVWAWYLAVVSLFKESRLDLSGKAVELTRVQYKPFRAFDYNSEDLRERILPTIFPDITWTEEATKELIQGTWTAKVHAEASLMGLASSTIQVCSHHLHSQSHLSKTPVGISKKCCRLCWLLKEHLNAEYPDLNLVLPGTHGIFYPWIPPPGIPDAILKSLRDELVKAIRTVIKTSLTAPDSRQSLDDDFDLDMSENSTGQVTGVGIDEYSGRNGGASERLPPFIVPEQDDDSVTVSSRDNGRLSAIGSSARNRGPSPLPDRSSELSGEASWDTLSRSTRRTQLDLNTRSARQNQDPFADSNGEPSPNSVFDRLRQEDDAARPNYDLPLSDQRRTEWITEQKKRAKQLQGVLPASSASDELSLLEQEDQVGDLSLQRAPTGKLYYMYGSGASQSQGAGFEDREIEIDPSIDGGINGKPRPTSRHLDWVATQRQKHAVANLPHLHCSEPSLDTAIPAEIFRQEDLTCCSGCGRELEFIKYVCEICGEKEPGSHLSSPTSSNKGKGRDIPLLRIKPTFTPPSHSISKPRPLPPEPSMSTSLTTLLPPSVPLKKTETGFELCPFCVEELGYIHALESQSTNEPGLSPTASNFSSSSLGDAAAQRRRAAPKEKGQLRHVYIERSWGHRGWDDVVHTDAETEICSACGVKTSTHNKMYNQVHEIHPSHAFLVLRGKLPQEQCKRGILFIEFCSSSKSQRPLGNQMYKGDSGAGLPGNIDSADGGHLYAHISIKIPFPLPSYKIQPVSRKARTLWSNRVGHSKAASEISSYARTVIGIGNMHTSEPISEDHGIACNSSESDINVRTVLLPSRDITHAPPARRCRRPVDQPITSNTPMIPELYEPGPSSIAYNIGNPADYLSITHPGVFCDLCVTEIQGAWFRCAYCGKDLCSTCELLDTHNDTHIFLALKSRVNMQALKKLLVDMESPSPIINYQIYL
ncbi:hypothetical protein GGU10DRAFT_373864 [Lentinula aff. detonsa]|uniref:ZZ-type domain-containing protein n=1 Tax=Lentinula aff. detonsa TaxID=2804958 RepID=A0AA38KHF8_9AGAR|nr:hypothetical protein GGU10DRAFT_373864 [Lentinula aff. detonsa]